MLRFQNILYVSCGTSADETDSLKQALRVARDSKATLQIVVFCPKLPKKFSRYEAGYEASLGDRMKASLEEALTHLKMAPDEVAATVTVEAGNTPSVRIVQRVVRNGHDLLIKQPEETASRAGFRALDMQLLRTCPCPVWLSRPTTRRDSDIRVGVAVDPQSEEPVARELASKLLQLSRSLADTYSGELYIISCWDYPIEDDLRYSPYVVIAEECLDEALTEIDGQDEAATQKLLGELGVAGRYRLHCTRGNPEQTIPQFVEQLQLDILVMGTVARTGIPGFIIGNTAENTLHELRCSLLAVKPSGFVSPVSAR
jgi:universal stress protein E